MLKSTTIAVSLAAALAASPLYASEEAGHGSHGGHNYYAAVKVVRTMGDDVHGLHPGSGTAASGFGLDLGYKLSHNLAVEFAYTKADGDIDYLHLPSEAVTYTTMAINGVYMHHLSDGLALVGKLGMLKESEDVAGHTASDTGLGYAVGVEYRLSGGMELLAEYEGSGIESPRGAALMAGVKFGF